MKPELIRTGMAVRFENQKWKGIVRSTSYLPEEVEVEFEGEQFPEMIDPQYLKPYEQGVEA